MIRQLWHSFFVQMFFNYHTMLSVGACYLLDKLLDRNEIPKAIRLRLLIFFNGHPYLLPYAVSAIAREVEKGSDEEKVMRFIDSISGFLGAIGDQYYWNSLKPIILLIPISLYVFSVEGNYVIGVSIFSFLLFNYLQMKERYRGLRLGREKGFAIVNELKKLKLTWVNQHLAKLAFILVFLCLIIYFIDVYENVNLTIISLISLAWGMVSGRRGNSKKYLLLAIASFILLEIFL